MYGGVPMTAFTDFFISNCRDGSAFKHYYRNQLIPSQVEMSGSATPSFLVSSLESSPTPLTSVVEFLLGSWLATLVALYCAGLC